VKATERVFNRRITKEVDIDDMQLVFGPGKRATVLLLQSFLCDRCKRSMGIKERHSTVL